MEAARLLSDADSEPGRHVRSALAAQCPLSKQGIDRALRNHLEVNPSPHDLEKLIRAAGDATHVHVVLSGNVFVGALRAIAIAVAAAPRVTVRMSRRESVFSKALLRAVSDPGVVDSVSFLSDPDREKLFDWRGCEVHLYGRDATIEQISATLSATVRVRPHGSGLGIAVVGVSAEVGEAADAIAQSVIPFDQRGCLSPRVVLVEGGEGRCEAVAMAISESLKCWERRVPIGNVSCEERGDIIRYRDTCHVAGRLFEAGSGCVGMTLETLWVAPVGRCIHVVSCEKDRVEAMLAPLQSAVTAVGIAGDDGDMLVRAVCSALPLARHSAAEQMQKPPLDGPVDRRTCGLWEPAEVVRHFARGMAG